LPGSWYYFWHGYPEEPIETPHQRAERYRQMRFGSTSAAGDAELAAALTEETDPIVRAEMVRTLATLPTAAASEALKRALNDPSDFVRVACCQALGKRGGADSVENLASVLRSEKNTEVRLAATRALGEIKDEGAVRALGIALEDSNVAMQHQAMVSLENSTGKYFGTDVNAWRAFAQGQEVTPQHRSIADRVHEFIYR
jgi:HEAT repeat protein